MNKNSLQSWKRMLSLLLALLLLGGCLGMALATDSASEETPTEPQTEEAPAEQETTAPTEAQTEAPTEAQTEAPTEQQNPGTPQDPETPQNPEIPQELEVLEEITGFALRNTNTITVYFTDSFGWGGCNVYYSGGPEWPGKSMDYYRDNDFAQRIYKAKIPSDTNLIIFNGSGEQTVDITEGIEDGAMWYSQDTQDDQGHYDVGLVPGQPAAEPTAEPTQAVGNDTITVYFIDALNWGGCNVYYWNGGPSWPGIAMTKVGTDNNHDVYSATIDTIPSNITGIIFNSNGKETVDIAEGIEDGARWRTTGEMEGGKYKVELVEATEPPTEQPTEIPTEPTSEPSTEPATEQNTGEGYYVVGSMTDWQIDPGYKLNGPSDGVYSLIGLALTTTTQFKVGYSEDGAIVTTWYPDGMDNSYGLNGEITTDGTYNIYFSPDGQGDEDWFYNYIYVVEGIEPTVEPTEPLGNTITVYFTDSFGWGGCNVYYSGGPEWPGNPMDYYEPNDYGEPIYKATIPSDTNLIIFNGSGGQTVDITEGIGDGAMWYPTRDQDGSGHYYVKRVGSDEPGTEEPTEMPTEPASEPSTEPATEQNTGEGYYVVGSMTDWQIDPGYKLNGPSDGVYSLIGLELSAGTVLKVIYSADGDTASVWYPDGMDNGYEISVSGIYDIYVRPNYDGNEDWYEGCIYVAQGTYVEPTVEPTEELGDTITVYFVDVQNYGDCNVYCWPDGGDWPGNDMTKVGTDNNNHDVYSATIPTDTYGIIFNGNGRRTVDINEDITNGAAWQTIEETDDQGRNKVEQITSCTVTFVPDNGDESFTQDVNFFGKATRPDPDPTNGNAPFLGWYLVMNGSMAEDPFDFENTPITGDITLKAKWASVVTLAASTDCGGASVGNITFDTAPPYYEGDEINVTAPQVGGYSFRGWYKDGNQVCTSLAYNFSIEEDTVLVAKYEAIGSAAVRINVVNSAAYTVGTSSTGQQGGTEIIPLGTTLTLNAVEGDRVLQWENGSGKVMGRGATLSFEVVNDMEVTLVYKASVTNQSYVQFVSDYGQVLAAKIYGADDSISFPDAPTKFGYTFQNWVFEGTSEVATEVTIKEKFSTDPTITIKPKYAKDEVYYTVTVEYEGVTRDEDTYSNLSIGTGYTVHAPAIDGSVFQEWRDSSGKTLGYGQDYFLMVNSNVTLTAVYGSSQVEATPTITLGALYQTVAGSTHKVSGAATRSVPDGYTVVEVGMLYARDVDGLTEENFTVDNANVGKYFGTSNASDGVLYLNVKVATDDVKVSLRGFMCLRDNSTGNTGYYYTNMAESTFAQLN